MAKDINTPMQTAFLDALFDTDVQGDIRKAMKKAGYSENTPTKDVIGPLKDQIIERAKDYMALNAGKAVFGMVNLLDRPATPGAKAIIAAAESIMDRVGIVKKDASLAGLPKGAIILLPPKKEVPMIEAEYTILEEDS